MPKPVAPREDRRLLAIALVLGALFAFTIIDVSAKWLVTRGLPPLEVVFARYGVHFLLVLGLLAPSQGRAIIDSRNVGLELLRGLALLGSTISNFVALMFLPLTTTGTIMFLIPLIVCALAVPLLGERMGWRRWVAVLIGFAGILVIIRPGTEAFHWAVFFSVAGAVCASFYNITTRKLAGVDSAQTQQIYAASIATLCIAPFALPGWVWPNTADQWLAFFAMGMAAGVGHLMFSIAHQFAPASTLAPFTYVQIIYLTGASWLVFRQAPDFWFYFGVPIVVSSGLWIWARERQLARDQASADARIAQSFKQSPG